MLKGEQRFLTVHIKSIISDIREREVETTTTSHKTESIATKKILPSLMMRCSKIISTTKMSQKGLGELWEKEINNA
jgi:hypothetical protein